MAISAVNFFLGGGGGTLSHHKYSNCVTDLTLPPLLSEGKSEFQTETLPQEWLYRKLHNVRDRDIWLKKNRLFLRCAIPVLK